MQTKIFHLNDKNSGVAVLSQYYKVCGDNGDGNHTLRNKTIRILRNAMKNELTDRQRVCVEKFYIDGQDVPSIAKDLGIRPTTVYKHLKLARIALKKCNDYL